MWNDHPTKPFLPSMIYVQKAITLQERRAFDSKAKLTLKGI